MERQHIPVLLKESMEALAVRPGGRYVDGTFGRGGHAREIVRRGGRVLGIDRDDAAIESARRARVDGLRVVKGNHGDLRRIVNEEGWDEVDGILLDLGVSSPQLADAGRGFSFQSEGPLDMRMDQSYCVTAADLVNGESSRRLEAVFKTFGEEPLAHRIAKAIAVARSDGRRFETTVDLAAFVERLIGRRGAHHPATRVFQALRMAVNDELGELERALVGGMELLASGGRFAVIAFESLSDRMVKRFFAAHVGRMRSLQQGGEEWEGSLPRARAVTRRAVAAGEREIGSNPRARSAKLRAIEKE